MVSRRQVTGPFWRCSLASPTRLCPHRHPTQLCLARSVPGGQAARGAAGRPSRLRHLGLARCRGQPCPHWAAWRWGGRHRARHLHPVHHAHSAGAAATAAALTSPEQSWPFPTSTPEWNAPAWLHAVPSHAPCAASQPHDLAAPAAGSAPGAAALADWQARRCPAQTGWCPLGARLGCVDGAAARRMRSVWLRMSPCELHPRRQDGA